jgi:uncharacterized protein
MLHETPLATGVESLSWGELSAELDARGAAVMPCVLDEEQCAEMVAMYRDEARFRKLIDMGGHGYGEGEYKYFAYPLPPVVEELRAAFYPHLAVTANRWADQLGLAERYPDTLDEFLARCAEAGQTRPTPLMLRYETGGYNCLHQDLYGAVAFPLQVVFVLSQQGRDYTGGELLIVEQRPRAQSKGQVFALEQGQGLIFTNRYRPVMGKRGAYRVNVRHGVSPLRSGERYTLGLIFHDAA